MKHEKIPAPFSSTDPRIVGRALRLPYNSLSMTGRAAGAAALHFCFALGMLFAPMLCAQDSKPRLESTTAGRLTGWGWIADGKPLEDTLPAGWKAENIVSVSAGNNHWAALKADGTVITGGKNDWANEPVPGHVGKAIAVAMGFNFCMALRPNGTVALWGEGDLQNLVNGTEGLTNVVAISAGVDAALALRADGTCHFWGKRYTPEYWKTTETPARAEKLPSFIAELKKLLVEIVAIDSGESTDLALRKDGILVQWTNNGVEVYVNQRDRAEPPISKISASQGAGASFGMTADGELVPSMGATRGKEFEMPADIGPVEAIFGGHQGGVVRKKGGEYFFWGKDTLNVFSDTARYASLIDFDIGGHRASKSAFVIGIEPSFTNGFTVLPANHPEVQAALSSLETERLAADDDLVAFENRYLEELKKLKAAAAKNDRPKIVGQVEDEIENFREVSRSAFASPKRLVDLQNIYRDGVAERGAKRDEAVIAVYEKAVADLQTLQDSLTQAQKLPAAVEARAFKEKIAVVRDLLKTPTKRSKNPDTKPAAQSLTFKPIPDDQKIFAIGDPRVEGELVVLGTVDGFKPDLDAADTRRIADLDADISGFAVLRANGSSFLLRRNKLIELSDAPKLETISANSAVYGIERRGGFWTNSDALKLPESIPADDIVALCSRWYDHDHLVAIVKNGSVRGWGEYYQRDKFAFKVPPELLTANDVIQIAVNSGSAAALRKTGEVVCWGESGMIDLPDRVSDLVQMSGRISVYAGLKRDGTVVAWTGDNDSRPGTVVPAGLTDVVEVATGHDICLALRTDGTWIGWGNNSHGLLDQLDKLKGVRRVSIGGTDEKTFIVGIRPDPADLKK